MKHLLLILTIVIYINLTAQTPTWQWINVGGSNGTLHSNQLNFRTKQIGTDAQGNIYGIASVSSSGITIDTLPSFNGNLYDDFVVFSYDCQGEFRWIQLFGSVGDDVPGGIVVDPDGSVYVSGSVGVSNWGYAQFADSIIPATNNILKAYFLAKLNSSGHLEYLNLPGPPNHGYLGYKPIRMESDNQGNPVVLTWFSDSTTWNGHHVNGRGNHLIKFNKSDGSIAEIVELDFKYSQNYGSNYRFIEFTIDNDNSVYLYSYVPDTLFIENDTLFRDNDNGILSNLLARFDVNGNVLWYKEIKGYWGSDSSQFISGKPIIIENKLFMEAGTQSYNGSTFLSVPINNPIASSSSKRTKVFASFDKQNGNFINAINLKSTDNIDNTPINKSSNQLVAAGSGGGLVILNNSDTLKPNGGRYPFIVSMDTNLTHFNWGIATRTLNSNTGLTPTYLHMDHNGNILIGGGLTGPITNTAGDTTNLVASSENFCIAKVALSNDSCACAASIPSLAVVGSSGNTLIVKGSATNQPDSLYLIWGDGDSTLYANAGSHISHSYANAGPWNICLRAYGFCGVVNSCLSNLYAGIYPTENNKELRMEVYPNPFGNQINLSLSKNVNHGNIGIYDLLGKEVYHKEIQGKHLSINLQEIPKGIYFVRLSTKNGMSITRKIIKN